jgi:hypothetical protein
LFYIGSQAVEVHVTRVAIVAGADNANLRFPEVVIREPYAMKHCLRRGQGGILCDGLAVLVEFHL